MQNLRFLLCLFLATSASAQVGIHSPSSLQPGTSTPLKEPAKSNKKGIYSPQRNGTVRYKKPRVEHTAQYEFYERVEKAAREKQRILRILSKRAYTDPRYFGHKRIPKRRPPHKMRFCSECHIRH
jgi:hypothetical protein